MKRWEKIFNREFPRKRGSLQINVGEKKRNKHNFTFAAKTGQEYPRIRGGTAKKNDGREKPYAGRV